MRRLLLIYVLLYILSQSVSAKEACALMIHLSSGKQLVCLLDERPVVTFTDEEVVLTTHMHEVRYQSADVQKFTYTNVVADGIHATLMEKGLVRVDGNNLHLGGFAPDSDVSVYTVDGVLVVVTRTDGHGAASVTLPEQSGKVYVVKTSVANFKITKP